MFTPDRLVLGTAQIGMRYGIANRGRAPDRHTALELLAAARDLGVRELDTAPDYGEAESRIGSFLQRGSPLFEVATKLPALPDGLDTTMLQRQVEREVTGSLRRLGVDRLARYLIHRASDLSRYGQALVDALDEQRTRQRIGAIGLSAYAPAETRLLLDWPSLTVVQHPFSLLDRRLTIDRIAALRAGGVRIEARSVMLQGLIGLEPDDPVVDRLGARGALTQLRKVLESIQPAEIALPFALGAGADRALIGAENPSQLAASVESLDRPLQSTLADAIYALPQADDALIDPRRWPAR